MAVGVIAALAGLVVGVSLAFGFFGVMITLGAARLRQMEREGRHG